MTFPRAHVISLEAGNAGEAESTAAASLHAEYARRARRLAEPAFQAGPPRDSVPVLVFRLGEQACGVDLADVVEVVAAIPIAAVPGAPPYIAGVIPLHGEIRPVLNLRHMLGLPASGGAPPYLLLLRLGASLAALAADRAESVRLVGGDEVLAAGGTNGSAPSPYVRAWTRDAVLLLNTAAIGAEISRRAPPQPHPARSSNLTA